MYPQIRAIPRDPVSSWYHTMAFEARPDCPSVTVSPATVRHRTEVCPSSPLERVIRVSYIRWLSEALVLNQLVFQVHRLCLPLVLGAVPNQDYQLSALSNNSNHSCENGRRVEGPSLWNPLLDGNSCQGCWSWYATFSSFALDSSSLTSSTQHLNSTIPSLSFPSRNNPIATPKTRSDCLISTLP